MVTLLGFSSPNRYSYPQKTYVGIEDLEDQRSWNTRIYYQYHLDTALKIQYTTILN